MKITEWRKRPDLRAQWQEFVGSDAFQLALNVVRSMNTPFIIPGENPTVSAQRQAYQAGFHAALYAMEHAADLHKQDVQSEIKPEWEHILPKDENYA